MKIVLVSYFYKWGKNCILTNMKSLLVSLIFCIVKKRWSLCLSPPREEWKEQDISLSPSSLSLGHTYIEIYNVNSLSCCSAYSWVVDQFSRAFTNRPIKVSFVCVDFFFFFFFFHFIFHYYLEFYFNPI